MKNYLILLVLAAMFVAFSGCDTTDPFFFEDDFSMVPAPYDTLGVPREVRANGLKIYTQDPGSGEFAINERDRVLLFYTFRLRDGKIVQSSYANNRTLPDEFSMATTIRGFREGLIGLKEGGMRTLVIPPSLGYGASTTSQFRTDTLFYDIKIHAILE
jgi:peptidylprolyl isomerase